jgi:hypothetical protein
MSFIILTTLANKEVVLNTDHILTIEDNGTGGSAIYFYDKSPPVEFLEKPIQVITVLRAAGETVVT